MMILPTSVEPVKESFRTNGCSASGPPHSSPKPVSTLSTPRGRNSSQISATVRTASGASSAALSTIVLPAHKAGAIFSAPSKTGAFPGNYGADHADRLPPRVAEHMLAERDCLALQLAGQAAEIAKDIGRQPRLGPRLSAQRVTGFERNRAGEFLAARLERFGDTQEDTATVARDDFAPG